MGDSLQGAVGGVTLAEDLPASREGEGSQTREGELWCALNRKYCLFVVFRLFTGIAVAYHIRYCSFDIRISDRILKRPGKKRFHLQHLYTRGITTEQPSLASVTIISHSLKSIRSTHAQYTRLNNNI